MTSFSAGNYMTVGLVCFGLSLVVLIFSVILIAKASAKKTTKRWQIASAAVVPVVLWLYALWQCLPVLEKTERLYPLDAEDVKETVGVVASVAPSGDPQIYLANGRLVGADYVTIEEDVFYTIAQPKISEGSVVHIEYVDGEPPIVLKWREVSGQMVEEIEEEIEYRKNNPPLEAGEQNINVSPEAKSVSLLCNIMGMAGFVGSLLLVFLNRDKAAAFIYRCDSEYKGGIGFNRKVITFAIILVGFMLLLSVGEPMERGVGVVLLLLPAVAVFLLVDNGLLNTMKIEGSTLVFNSLGHRRSCTISAVTEVYWRNCRGLTGKKLVIVTEGGRAYEFPMDIYCGVQNTYDKLMYMRGQPIE